MRRAMITALLAGAVGMLSEPVPADAQKLTRCLLEAIDSCDGHFGGGDPKVAALRGWCYIIRGGWCGIFD